MLYADLPVARASVEINASPADVWALVSDVQLMVKLSAELLEITWLDGVDAPAVGHRFRARSFHAALGEWESTSTVVEWEPEKAFTWDVDAGQDERPSSTWGFVLDRAGPTTTLQQWGRMGPGRSGLSFAIDRLPHKEAKIVANRMQEFRSGIESNLEAIKALAEKAAA
ncbi:SRPBCC family protein [Pseudonocardia benzenivorans]|uniref:SRPBCC family protein n=1 Tax=Pseudonocardia benzenivorans TaxID=228005 RepID=A0ABW3VLN4_9PSEU|nr:cyclase [Pseudonocardia sp. D17]